MVRETPQNPEPLKETGSNPTVIPDLHAYRSERSPVPNKPDPDLLVACAVALVREPEKAPEKEKADDKPKEKKKPKDGDTVPLSELLTDYQTPFIDAYEKSKALKAGDAGKSPALEAVVDRMKACPWSGQIKVKFDSKATNPDYDPATSTITINPNDPVDKQIEMFAHEGFHSTNARLYQLYLDKDKPKDKKAYAEIMGDAEVGAFETEIKVHKELGHKGPVGYKYVDKDDKKQEADLAKLYEDKGRDGLKAFILDDSRTRMVIDKKEGLYTYRQYYEAAFPSYSTNFAANREFIQGLGKKDPNWSEKTLKEKDY